MANDNGQPFPIRRFGGSADYDDPTKIPPGLATVARNVRFRKSSVRTRDGSVHTMTGTLTNPGDVTGFDVLKVLVPGQSSQQVGVVMTDQGVLLRESPAGSGILQSIATPFILPGGASMQTAQAFNQIHMAISDLQNPLLPPMALDGRTGVVRPVSQNIVGGLWRGDLLYSVGDLVRSPDGRWWRCLVPTSPNINSTTPPQWPGLNGQFIGSVITAPASAVKVNATGTTINIGMGPWYVCVQNGVNGTIFMGPFSILKISEIFGGSIVTTLNTFQVQIPADPGASTWNIYIGLSPSLAAMTQKWSIVGTAAPQTFIATTNPTATAPPGAAGGWSPSTITDSNQAVWEEWTPACANQLPAPDIANPATTVSHNPGGGTIPAGNDVYVKLTFRIGSGESARSAALVYVNTGANDAITIAFGNNGGIRIPRWIAELNLNPSFFQGVQLAVYVASVATGGAQPLDSAYSRYGALVSLGGSVTISALSAGGTIISPSAAAGNFQTPSAAYDGNFNTSSSGPAGVPGYPASMSETWSGFPAGLTTNKVLKIMSSASISGSVAGGSAGLSYSLDNGVTWHTIYGVSVGRPLTTDSIAIPNGTDQTQIKVQAGATSSTGTYTSVAVMTVYEIWLDDATSPAGGTTSGNCYILSTEAAPPPVFIGENGTRYMAVLRADTEASLSPIDPGSPIPCSFAGRISANIITINRDNTGLVSATLDDVSQFALGQKINIQGCLADSTLNESSSIISIQMTLEPGGIVTYKSASAAVTQDSTGVVIAPAQVPPFAFLPTASQFSEEYVAAFSVVGADKGGPFFYISESDPDVAVTKQVVSLQGRKQVQLAIQQMNRYTGGYVQAQLNDITGLAAGQTALVQNTGGFAGFEGQFTIEYVEPTTGKAGNVYWTSPNQGNGGPTGAVGTMTVFIGTEGKVQAVLQDVTGLAAGQDVYLQNPTNAQFNGFTQIAEINGDVVTLALEATGSATGGTLQVLATLPTVAPAQTPTITSITRDASGNVVAQVNDVGGFTSGQQIEVTGVLDASFNGTFFTTGMTQGSDGISGTVQWQQSGAAATSTGGAIVGCQHPMVNFDDNSLSSSTDNDVTAQLTAMPAPNSVDIYFSPSLNAMVYTTGQDSNHYFSDSGDPANIQNPNGILGVEQANGKKTICFREMIDGELISCKEDGGYRITAGAVSPKDFGVGRVWADVRPAGPRAAAVGRDFLLIFDEHSGLHRYYRGELTAVGLEKQGTWDQINTDAAAQIWIEIDEDRREVHIGLPLGSSTKPNKEVVLNYFNGWNEPLMLTLSGEEMPDPHGRRWSDNDRNARLGRLLDRDLATPVDPRINHRQFLYGMVSDGSDNVHVDMTQPDRFDDNGVGIDSRYRPAYFSIPQLAIMKWQFMKGRALGAGIMTLTPVTEEKDSDYQPINVDLTDDDLDATADGALGSTPDPLKFSTGFGPIDNELCSIEFANGAAPDMWFELHEAVLYAQVSQPARKPQ